MCYKYIKINIKKTFFFFNKFPLIKEKITLIEFSIMGVYIFSFSFQYSYAFCQHFITIGIFSLFINIPFDVKFKKIFFKDK